MFFLFWITSFFIIFFFKNNFFHQNSLFFIKKTNNDLLFHKKSPLLHFIYLTFKLILINQLLFLTFDMFNEFNFDVVILDFLKIFQF